MTGTEIKKKFETLPKEQQKIVKNCLIALLIFIAYLILFVIVKNIMISKAKETMVKMGIGSSVENIVLKAEVNPFVIWTGKVHSLYLKVDKVTVKNFVIIHDFEIKTKTLDLKEFKGGFDKMTENSTGALWSCKLMENDFLSLLREKLKYGDNLTGFDVFSQFGMINIRTGFPFYKEICARPYLKNNSVYLEFNDGLLSMVPLKVINFGLLSKGKLHVYSFEFEKDAYVIKGTVI